MTGEQHLQLATKIWQERHRQLPRVQWDVRGPKPHKQMVCQCSDHCTHTDLVKPYAFSFLCKMTHEEFAIYYDALRDVVTIPEVIARIKNIP